MRRADAVRGHLASRYGPAAAGRQSGTLDTPRGHGDAGSTLAKPTAAAPGTFPPSHPATLPADPASQFRGYLTPPRPDD